MGTAKTQAAYDVHPGVAMVQKWVKDLKSKTGRSLEERIAVVKKEGPKDEKSRREWVKDQAQARYQQRVVDCRAKGETSAHL